jgi:hypothetical protein
MSKKNAVKAGKYVVITHGTSQEVAEAKHKLYVTPAPRKWRHTDNRAAGRQHGNRESQTTTLHLSEQEEPIWP